ncbi:MAG TPA: acyltransferase [Bacteroidia bacterium]|nr:acyltransferase [Bacteroidia bacterium]
MNTERILFLNGLRGILALIVFVHHFLYAFNPDMLFGGNSEAFLSGKWTTCRIFAYTPLNIFFNPGMAISFFFLLSGYVQSHHYLKTNDFVFLQKSFIKRYFRLMVPVLSILVLVFLFHRLSFIHRNGFPYNTLSDGWIKSMLPDNLSFMQVLKHGLVDCFYTGKSGYYQILWTMMVELYNSWMVIILLLVTHVIRRKIPLLFLWLAFQFLFLHSYYSAMFTMGLILCHLHLHSTRFNQLASQPIVKTICLAVGIYFASYPFTGYQGGSEKTVYQLISFFEKIPHFISYAIGDLLLFIFLLHSQFFKKLLSKSFLLFFGEISFMVYLVHFLIIFSFSVWMYQKLLPHLVSTANLWVTGLASFALIIAVSWLLTICIDRPWLTWCNVSIKKYFDI